MPGVRAIRPKKLKIVCRNGLKKASHKQQLLCLSELKMPSGLHGVRLHGNITFYVMLGRLIRVL